MKNLNKKDDFSQKILFLFDKLEKSEEDFIKLFWDNNPATLISRRKTVRSWFSKEIAQPKAFKFESYNISLLELENGQKAFSKASFVNNSFQMFQEQVEAYLEYVSSSKEHFEYKYMYYYDNFLDEINFVELNTLKKINERKYKIEILLPKEYKDREKNRYVGYLEIDRNYYYIVAKNNFEILTYYYMLNLGLKNSDTIYGLRLGKAYDDGSPLSAKNLLTKKLLSEEEKLELYLTLNETEEIKSKEAFSAFDNAGTKNFYENFYDKMEKMRNFADTAQEILKEEIREDTYTNIIQKEFLGISEIFKKANGGNSFHIHNIRRASKVYLQSLTKGDEVYIVSPLTENISILSEHDIKGKKSLYLNIETAKRGVIIHRIFIMNKNVTLTEYMKKNIEEMVHNGINVKIVKHKDIASIIGLSYDFMISNQKLISIYQRPIDRRCIYHVTKNRTVKDDLYTDYKKIKEKSINYHEFLKNFEEVDATILEKLQGEFHHYTYGSKIDKWGKHHFWSKRKITIDRFGKVHYFEKQKLIAEGKVVIHKNQTCLGLIKKGTENTILFTLDNQDVNFPILKVITTAKQYMEDGKDIISVGIFSRKALEEKKARELIGEEQYAIVLVDSDIKSRIANYLV